MYHRQGEDALDDSPVAVLYQRHAHTILHFIYRYVTSREDADDLVLEVFMAVLNKPDLVTWSDATQQAWLCRVARNKAIDHVRRVARRPSVLLDEAMDILLDDENCMPEVVAVRNEDHSQLRAHLTKLTVLQQEILRLRFVNDLPTKDIAQILNKSDNLVRVLLSRSLNILRRIYNQREGA